MIEKRQQELRDIQQRCYRINQSEVNIWLINCEINCNINTILFRNSYNFIDHLLSICSTYSSIIAQTSLFTTLVLSRDRVRKHTHSFVKSIHLFRFCSENEIVREFFETTLQFVRHEILYFVEINVHVRKQTSESRDLNWVSRVES